MADFYVSLTYATFCLTSHKGEVTKAPPIARWTIGKTTAEVQRYYRRKGQLLEWSRM